MHWLAAGSVTDKGYYYKRNFIIENKSSMCSNTFIFLKTKVERKVWLGFFFLFWFVFLINSFNVGEIHTGESIFQNTGTRFSI